LLSFSLLTSLSFSQVVNQEEGMDFDLAAAAMVAAADLHAPFWEKGPPEGVVRCSDQQSWLCLIKEKSMSVFRRERAAGRSGFLGGDAEDIGEFIHSNADAISFSLTQAPQTLAHCDYRAGNLMREKGGLGIKVLDWQTFTYGPGLYDVANIVVCSMTVAECEKHCKRLLRLYQSRLSELGIEYEWARLWSDFRLCVLQHCFVINYAFESVVDGSGEVVPDCPELFARVWDRIVGAARRYGCLEVKL